RQPSQPSVAPLEVDRNKPQPLRDAEAELDQALSLPGLRSRLVDLEHEQAGGELRPPLGESVQTRSQDGVLADPLADPPPDPILANPSRGQKGCWEMARGAQLHAGTATPAFVGGREPQANLVFEHMRRRIDLDAHGPPQSDPHGRA